MFKEKRLVFQDAQPETTEVTSNVEHENETADESMSVGDQIEQEITGTAVRTDEHLNTFGFLGGNRSPEERQALRELRRKNRSEVQALRRAQRESDDDVLTLDEDEGTPSIADQPTSTPAPVESGLIVVEPTTTSPATDVVTSDEPVPPPAEQPTTPEPVGGTNTAGGDTSSGDTGITNNGRGEAEPTGPTGTLSPSENPDQVPDMASFTNATRLEVATVHDPVRVRNQMGQVLRTLEKGTIVYPIGKNIVHLHIPDASGPLYAFLKVKYHGPNGTGEQTGLIATRYLRIADVTITPTTTPTNVPGSIPTGGDSASEPAEVNVIDDYNAILNPSTSSNDLTQIYMRYPDRSDFSYLLFVEHPNASATLLARIVLEKYNNETIRNSVYNHTNFRIRNVVEEADNLNIPQAVEILIHKFSLITVDNVSYLIGTLSNLIRNTDYANSGRFHGDLHAKLNADDALHARLDLDAISF